MPLLWKLMGRIFLKSWESIHFSRNTHLNGSNMMPITYWAGNFFGLWDDVIPHCCNLHVALKNVDSG